MNTKCPFLRGDAKEQNNGTGDCSLERCELWNRERNECWVMTAVKTFGGKGVICKLERKPRREHPVMVYHKPPGDHRTRRWTRGKRI